MVLMHYNPRANMVVVHYRFCKRITQIHKISRSFNTPNGVILKLRLIKTVLFHILMTFRGLFKFSCKLFGGIFIVSFLASITSGLPIIAKISCFTFGIGFSALGWYYDLLLLKLKPVNIELYLS